MPDANQWRIEIANKFSQIYLDQPNVAAVAIVGSVSYNMADCYSDLDLRVFWRASPSKTEREKYRCHAAKMGQYQSKSLEDDNLPDEVFFFGGDVDSGFQIDIKNGFAEPVEKAIQDPNVERNIGVLEVIKSALPLIGADTFRAWQSQIPPYPASLIQKRVQSNLRVGPWWLWEKFVEEGETRSFRRTLERLLVALTWLNQTCIRHAEYAKHTAQSLDHMKWKPENCWDRFQHILQSDPKSGLSELRKLVEETYDLVQTHVPEIDTSKLQKETFENRPSDILRSQSEVAVQNTNASQIINKLREVYASNPNVKSIVISGDVSRRTFNYAAIEITIFWMELPSDQDRKTLIEQLGGIQQKDYGYHDVQSVLRERVSVKNTTLDIRHIACQTFDTFLDDVLQKHEEEGPSSAQKNRFQKSLDEAISL